MICLELWQTPVRELWQTPVRLHTPVRVHTHTTLIERYVSCLGDIPSHIARTSDRQSTAGVLTGLTESSCGEREFSSRKLIGVDTELVMLAWKGSGARRREEDEKGSLPCIYKRDSTRAKRERAHVQIIGILTQAQ